MPVEIDSHYDVVVIGAGPAGMTAAIMLSEYDLKVAVFDEQAEPGGQIYRNVQSAGNVLSTVLGNDPYSRTTASHGQKLVDRFVACNASYFPQSLVWNLESLSCIAVRLNNTVHQTSARYVVIATGAQERPVVFAGWELPGVMGVGAAQIMLKSAGALPQTSPVLYGSGPLLYLYAAQIITSGLLPAAILDTASTRGLIRSLKYLPGALRAKKYLKDGVGLLKTVSRSGVPNYKNVTALNAFGDSMLKRIEFTSDSKITHIETELLLSHHGVIPEIQLLRAAGAESDWSESAQCWQPSLDKWGASSVEGLYVCGDGAGISGAYSAEYNAELASIDILYRAGVVVTSERDRLAAEPRVRSRRDKAIRPFLLVPKPFEQCK